MNFSIDKRAFICYNSQANKQRLVGQAVKTLASHAENMGSIPVRVTKTKGHPSRVSFLFCCDSVGIDPLERRAFGYGFVTLLRPSLWEACKTEQIPVQNLDGSMPERFLYSGATYVLNRTHSNVMRLNWGRNIAPFFSLRLGHRTALVLLTPFTTVLPLRYPWRACKAEQIPVQNLDGSMPERFFLSYGASHEESHPMGIAARPHSLPFVPLYTISTNICFLGKMRHILFHL